MKFSPHLWPKSLPVAVRIQSWCCLDAFGVNGSNLQEGEAGMVQAFSSEGLWLSTLQDPLQELPCEVSLLQPLETVKLFGTWYTLYYIFSMWSSYMNVLSTQGKLNFSAKGSIWFYSPTKSIACQDGEIMLTLAQTNHWKIHLYLFSYITFS